MQNEEQKQLLEKVMKDSEKEDVSMQAKAGSANKEAVGKNTTGRR